MGAIRIGTCKSYLQIRKSGIFDLDTRAGSPLACSEMQSLLLVDDDERTCEAIQRLLARMGYVVVCATSGAEALVVLHDLRFDLVILDLMMPEMDGLEVLRRLRADPPTREVKVILYSAADDRETAEEAMSLGASDCVLKSGGFFALYDRIEQLVPQDDADHGPRRHKDVSDTDVSTTARASTASAVKKRSR